MGWASVRQIGCTLCGESFSMRSGEMVHPADTVCDGCIRTLWERLGREGAESVEASLSPRPRYGIAAEALASQIVRRLQDLQEMVKDRAELETALQMRRG
jgi:hypothetical protein